LKSTTTTASSTRTVCGHRVDGEWDL
jgi:hypothetical protein